MCNQTAFAFSLFDHVSLPVQDQEHTASRRAGFRPPQPRPQNDARSHSHGIFHDWTELSAPFRIRLVEYTICDVVNTFATDEGTLAFLHVSRFVYSHHPGQVPSFV
jgi:hypothetical protein